MWWRRSTVGVPRRDHPSAVAKWNEEQAVGKAMAWLRTGRRLARLLGLAALQARVIAFLELVLELFDAPGCVNELQLASVKGMAAAADIDLQLLTRAPRLKCVAATASDRRFEILWMNVFLHRLALSASASLTESRILASPASPGKLTLCFVGR